MAELTTEQMVEEMYAVFKKLEPLLDKALRNKVTEKVATEKMKGWLNNG